MFRRVFSSVYAALVMLIYVGILAFAEDSNFRYLTYWSLCVHALFHASLFVLVASDWKHEATGRTQANRFVFAFAPVCCVLAFAVFITINVLYYHYATDLFGDNEMQTRTAGKIKIGDFGVHTLPVILAIFTAKEVYGTPELPSNGTYFLSGVASALIVHLMHYAFTC
ncbi:hypothetical protein CYMTET_40340 [Cymbomonas tetramitiformis]|uniref:Uncharacterized protein n=1 Tax=Cymbomonas tetramitiformis TaxID=36881 RepID=A0AAE0CAD5_9CHLO|nr:hypothetical protein CYMTET_40340 [Cymbomonas tetramitiformis]